LMRPAVAFLERLGLGRALGPDAAAPLATMRIVDATARLIRSPAVTFRAAEIGEDYFGVNIPNAVLNAALADAVRARGDIVWHETMVEEWRPEANGVEARLADGTVVRAALAVA